MQEVFEKIIEKLEEQRMLHAHLAQNDILTEQERETQSRFCGCFSKAKEIVKNEAAEYDNGWIPCSERLPEKRDWYWAVFEEIDTGYIGIPYIAYYLMESYTNIMTTEDGWVIDRFKGKDEYAEYCKNLRCVAWQPLPGRYKPKGE